MLAVWLLAVVVACLLVEHWLRNRRFYELAAKVPGWKTLPLIGNAHQCACNNEQIMDLIRSVTKSYVKDGYILKLWLGYNLSFGIGDPEDAGYILKNFLGKHNLTQLMHDLFGQGILFGPVDIWRWRRKRIVPAFNKKILESFVEVFQEQSDVLNTILEQHVGKGPVNLTRILTTLTLTTVTETSMGMQLNAQTQPSPVIEAFQEYFIIVGMRLVNVFLHPYYLFRLSKHYSKQKKALDFIKSFTDEVIRRKRLDHKDSTEKMSLDSDEALVKYRPFLDWLIGLSGKENAFSDIALREETLTILGAASDTSAMAIGYTLTLLGAHPHVQDRVYQEIIETLGDAPINKDNLCKLVFLEAVIKESMRLYPPIPFITRNIDKEAILPSGRILPAGCGVLINIYGLHRHEKQWGADVEEFRPERFLTEDNRHPCAYMPFSYGTRNCIGYRYAMMSLKTVLPTVIRKFKVKATEPTRLSWELMMRPTEGFNIEFTKRV